MTWDDPNAVRRLTSAMYYALVSGLLLSRFCSHSYEVFRNIDL